MLAGDNAAINQEVKTGLAVINRALDLLSEAADDPLVQNVGLPSTLSIRIGWGTGEQIADGQWTSARQLPGPPPAPHEQLDPHQEVAEQLAGREPEADD